MNNGSSPADERDVIDRHEVTVEFIDSDLAVLHQPGVGPCDVDFTGNATRCCELDLPQAPKCGFLVIECPKCGLRAMLTVSGRYDDPRSVRLGCAKGERETGNRFGSEPIDRRPGET